MNRTGDLQTLFEAKREKSSATSTTTSSVASSADAKPSSSSPSAKVQTSAKRAVPSPSQIFLTALASMSSGCRKLQSETDRVIQSTFTTMDEVLIGSTDDLGSQIKEVIHTGVSLATTVGEFLTSVDAAIAVEKEIARKLEERRKEQEATTQLSQQKSASVFGSVQRMAQQTEQWLLRREKPKGGEDAAAAPTSSCLDVLAHCRVGGEVLQAMIVDDKLRLALCEEELELFKKDMFLLGRGGVVSVDPPEDLAHPTASPSPTATRGGTTNNVASSLSSAAATTASKTRSTVTATLTNVSNSLGAAGLLKSAGSGASSIRQAVSSLRSSGGERSSQSGNIDGSSRHRHGQNGGRRRVLHITEEESRELKQESVLLEQQLTESSVKAAKEVEASIRELSHLTNLLNEQALIQSEQLSLVAKNTEETLTNVSKASNELQKPARQSSWMLNPTRQLIAVLWICIMTILVAHFLIR
ncbi:GPI-anchored surface protein, putative [Bodo saltans]|uniref:GPI-anchored surface protein, putative n=1 Tax=Bodo saltans TaxID=75058 RepID=A0A0S4JSZ1_BODSA|nr:GPI-anchored surface protein, putative [Bodo saltans]|eukprot:CUG91671.1 GPI-anchored surface protein, putative [Bodo saltans]